MLLFLYEYCTAEATDSTLRTEGEAMLAALVEDASRCSNVQTATLDFAVPTELQTEFDKRVKQADATIVIAPEFDGILTQRCQWVAKAGGRLLGCSPEVLALTADKVALADHLKRSDVPTLPSSSSTYPAVCKPRFGAGSQATFLVRDASELAQAFTDARVEGFTEMMLQPYRCGMPASVVCFVGCSQTMTLRACEQRLSDDGRFHYRGGRLPLDTALDARAVRLARRACDAVPGLLGYVGIDLILGECESDDVVVEINPRWTTSYLGLRRLSKVNLFEVLLALMNDREPPRLEWNNCDIEFTPDGRSLTGG